MPAFKPSTLKGGPGFRREGVGPFCGHGIQAAGNSGANASAETFGVNVGAAEVGADTGQVLGVGDHRSNRLGPPYNTSSTPIPQAANGIRLIPKPESNRSAILMGPGLDGVPAPGLDF